MTKRIFDKSKLQRKSVKTVWYMMQRRECNILMSRRSIFGSIYFQHKKHLLYHCERNNLVTVKQILEAIK